MRPHRAPREVVRIALADFRCEHLHVPDKLPLEIGMHGLFAAD